MRQAGYHRIFGRSVEAGLTLKDAEGLELAGDLVAKCVRRDHDQQAVEALAGVQGQHRLGFACPGRHDDGCRLGRARGVREGGVERADLRPPEPWRCGFGIGGRPRLAQVEGIFTRCSHAFEPARHLGTTQRRGSERCRPDPAPFAALQPLADGLRMHGVGNEQHKVGVELSRRLGAEDLQCFAAFQARLKSADTPNRKGLEPAEDLGGGYGLLTRRTA